MNLYLIQIQNITDLQADYQLVRNTHEQEVLKFCIHEHGTTRGKISISSVLTSCLWNYKYTSCNTIWQEVLRMCIHHYVTTRGTTLISTTVTSCLKNKLYTSCIPIGLDVLSLYILQYISARGTNLVYYEVPYYIRNEIYVFQNCSTRGNRFVHLSV
jgi:hypothetical protein